MSTTRHPLDDHVQPVNPSSLDLLHWNNTGLTHFMDGNLWTMAKVEERFLRKSKKRLPSQGKQEAAFTTCRWVVYPVWRNGWSNRQGFRRPGVSSLLSHGGYLVVVLVKLLPEYHTEESWLGLLWFGFSLMAFNNNWTASTVGQCHFNHLITVI